MNGEQHLKQMRFCKKHKCQYYSEILNECMIGEPDTSYAFEYKCETKKKEYIKHMRGKNN